MKENVWMYSYFLIPMSLQPDEWNLLYYYIYQLFKISKVYDIRFQKWARILEFLREASVFCVVYVFLWIKNYIIKIIPFPISSAFKLFDEGVEGLDLHIINCVW